MKFKRIAVTAILAGLFATSAVAADTLNASQVGNISTANQNLSSEFLTVNWSGGEQNIGLIQFDLAAYNGQTVGSATLNLFHRWNGGAGASFGLFMNTASWDSGINSWSSAPSHLATPTAVLSITDDNQGIWRSVDVTSAVNSWAHGSVANYGFTLQRLDQDNPFVYFASTANSGGAPTLSISAVPEPETYAMMMLGLGILGGVARRRSAKQR